MAAEQLPIDFYEYDLTLKFAHAIVENALITYEASCHNDRWMQTECRYCHTDQFNRNNIKHKPDCIVYAADDYIKSHS